MDVRGYDVGPIDCKAAFVSDFEVSTDIPMLALVGKIDADRRTMAVEAGMRNKYLPFRFDPATGARQIGGRYLFETWADAEDYARFTERLEFEPGVTFWAQPVFSNIDKGAWHVVGAHDFTLLQTHYASRFERFRLDDPPSREELEAAWPKLRDAAQAQGLASAWLLSRPDIHEIGLVTAMTQAAMDDETEARAEAASRTLAALATQPSLSRHLPASGSLVFDRTSLNLTIWLPLSDRLGGDASIFPTFPVHPAPSR